MGINLNCAVSLKNLRAIKFPPSFMGNKQAIQQTVDSFTPTYKKVGKHKIPRYIYHLTTQENYEKMKKTGYILPTHSNEDEAGEAIFATELTNLFKYWPQTKGDIHDANILEKLLFKASYTSPNLVMIKIPTSKLDPDSLFMRSQYEYFDDMNSMPDSDFVEDVIAEIKKSNLLDNYTGNDDIDSICHYLIQNKLFDTEEYKNIEKMVDANRNNTMAQKMASAKAEILPATSSGLFEQKGHAIEYIYKKPIPIDIVELSNPVNVSKLEQDHNNNKTILEIFQNMFKGKPEEKAVNKCLLDKLA